MSTPKSELSCYLVLLWITGVVTAYYYVQDTGGPSSTPSCTLASPAITPSATGGYNVHLPADLEMPNGPVRVGYIKTSYNFVYLGCTERVGLPHSTTVHEDISADLGQCQYVCGTKYIGISSSKCYCFHDAVKTNVMSLTCTRICERPRSALCGSSYHASISLYEYYEGYIDGGNSKGECLMYKPRYSVAWHDCGSPLKGLCRGAVISSTQALRWDEYARGCLINNTLPVFPSLQHYISQEYFWCAIVRQPYIEQVTDPYSYKSQSYHGWVMKDGTTFKLFFANSNVSLPLLCSKANSSSTFPTHASIRTQTSTRKTTEIVPQTNTTRGVHIATSISSARYTDPSASQGEDSNSAMVAVYVTVPVVLIGMIVGTICIIRIKRKNGDNRTTGPKIRSNTTKARGAVINTVFDSNDAPTVPVEIQEPKYWVLEKTNDLDDTTIDTMSFDSHFTVDSDYNLPEEQTEDAYDHTGGKESYPVDDTYNHLGQEDCIDVEGTYNRTQKWGSNKNNYHNVTENTYDRTGDEHSDEYNTAGMWKADRGTDDTYSHAIR